jgi:hypothetical protein
VAFHNLNQRTLKAGRRRQWQICLLINVEEKNQQLARNDVTDVSAMTATSRDEKKHANHPRASLVTAWSRGCV